MGITPIQGIFHFPRYEFREDIDFIRFDNSVKAQTTYINTIEYHLSIDMAKALRSHGRTNTCRSVMRRPGLVMALAGFTGGNSAPMTGRKRVVPPCVETG
ncbi:MAG: antA/AntB antirepressor family protein [Desulfosarcina sp.]|nr:antA/AntB antirepressor family protein [Desulfosarcina sp.]